ncbi:MAG: hypothetical protein AAGA65_28060 [Actinomycetota bacterium]
MLTSVQIAGLVAFNLLLLILLFVAFRLIGFGEDRRERSRRNITSPEELFSFDSWSETDQPRRPMGGPGRSGGNGR